eukprot:COSAG02_NODE_6109_length_3791_cov_241.041441_1_plen_102_part_10
MRHRQVHTDRQGGTRAAPTFEITHGTHPPRVTEWYSTRSPLLTAEPARLVAITGALEKKKPKEEIQTVPATVGVRRSTSGVDLKRFIERMHTVYVSATGGHP